MASKKHIVRSHIRGWNPTGEKDAEKNLKPGDIVSFDPEESEHVAHLVRPGVLEPIEDGGSGEQIDAGAADGPDANGGSKSDPNVDKANGKGGAADPAGENVTEDGKLKKDPAAEAAANTKSAKK